MIGTFPFQLLYPQILVTLGLIGALMLPRVARSLAALSLIAGMALIFVNNWTGHQTDLIRQDGFSLAWQFLFFLGAMPLIINMNPADEVPIALTMGAVLGMGLMACANHLFVLFLGFELMSLSTYLLIYSLTNKKSGGAQPLEAAVKYFFSGGMAAALFLFGLSIYYAVTGTMAMDSLPPSTPWLLLAVTLMACAALFKIGAFPMHFWLPDVYEAAVPELTGFMSTAMKAAGFLMLLRLMMLAGPNNLAGLEELLPWIALATMTVGNLLALRQERLQRLLAYSSISHVGYMLAGAWAWSRTGAIAGAASTVYLYLAVYLFMNTGAFLFLRFTGISEMKQLRGFGSRSPVLAAFFALMLLSLAGIPPTGGFLAKFFVIWDLIRTEGTWLAVAVAINSLIGLAYYFKMIQSMILMNPDESTAPSAAPDFSAKVLMGACSIATLCTGLLPVAHRFITLWLQGGKWPY